MKRFAAFALVLVLFAAPAVALAEYSVAPGPWYGESFLKIETSSEQEASFVEQKATKPKAELDLWTRRAEDIG